MKQFLRKVISLYFDQTNSKFKTQTPKSFLGFSVSRLFSNKISEQSRQVEST